MTDRENLAEMLAQGLDLCVRARNLDGPALGQLDPKPGEIVSIKSVSATPHIWVLDQYDKDLEAWEQAARSLMTKLGFIK